MEGEVGMVEFHFGRGVISYANWGKYVLLAGEDWPG